MKVGKGVAACLFFLYLVSIPIVSQADTKISSVKIQIRAEGFEEEPELEIESLSDRYEVIGFELVGGLISLGEGPGAVNEEDYLKLSQEVNEITYEIELSADEDYFFGTMQQKDIKLSGIDATCTKAVRKDNGSTLVLTVELPGLQEYVGRIDNAYFKDQRAQWDSAANASLYGIMLYKNSKRIGLIHETNGTSYDFTPLMTEPGSYFFKVYPIAPSGKKGKTIESTSFIVNESIPIQQTEGWVSNASGWRYQYSDGVYVQNNWIEDNGAWYYFDENGDMLRNRWQNWKHKRYYLGADGKMVERIREGRDGN